MPPPAAVPPRVRLARRRRLGRAPNVQSALPLHSPRREDENSLYYILRNCNVSLNMIVEDWTERFRLNKETALTQLIQLFIDVSGSSEIITQEMICGAFNAIISKMTREFNEDNDEYPLAKNGRAWKKFRMNFCDFIKILIKTSQPSIVHDRFFMDNLTTFLMTLSDTKFKAFRHTATLALMKMMTALVEISLLVTENFKNLERQEQDERSRGLEREEYEVDTNLIQVLEAKRQVEEYMTKTVAIIVRVFDTVVVHRYKDTLPEIRAITIVEIGIWIEILPAIFLSDTYLKYIGWTLYDKVAEVRLKCLQALQPLYSREDLKEKLEPFTIKFKNRLLFMSLDKNCIVAVQAVNLLTSILKSRTGILTNSDCRYVCELIFSLRRAVGQAAGEFFKVYVLNLNENVPLQMTSGGKRRLPNTPYIRSLVHFYRESQYYDYGNYLVDSLIDSNPMMKDWECMTDLLLEIPGDEEEDFDGIYQSALIKIMKYCVQHAATGEMLKSQQLQLKESRLMQREKAKVAEDRQKLTKHFIKTLPFLLAKHSNDAINLSCLLAIPQYFNLDVYITTGQESTLIALFNIMKDIINCNNKYIVLEQCSKTLEDLCTKGTAIYRKCEAIGHEIIDSCATLCKLVITDWRVSLEGGEIPGEDKKLNLMRSLKKICTMNMHCNLNRVNVWELIFCYLPQHSELTDRDFPSKALFYSIKCCFFYITWSLADIPKNQYNSHKIDLLRDYLHAFIDQCKTIIVNGYDTDVKELAYLSICDLAVYFSDPLYSVHHKDIPKMQMLVYEPDPETCNVLSAFVQEFVFVQPGTDLEDDKRILQLDRERRSLAAYCKLIAYKAIPIWQISDIFIHYINFCDNFGDIIHLTLTKARDFNRVHCAVAMVLSLQHLFTQMLTLNAGKTMNEIKSVQEFLHLKVLAKQLSLSFGSDALKNRRAIASLHCTGISFAMREGVESIGAGSSKPPPNLLFLEIIIEFIDMLLRQDKSLVLEFLHQKATGKISPSSCSDDWYPLILYRYFLIGDDAESNNQRGS